MRAACVCGAAVTPRLFEYAPVFLAPNGSVVDAPVANGSTLNRVQAVANRTAFCARTLANLTAWQQLMTNATQQLLIDRRLGDGSTTGKIAARNSVRLLCLSCRHLPLACLEEAVGVRFTSDAHNRERDSESAHPSTLRSRAAALMSRRCTTR